MTNIEQELINSVETRLYRKFSYPNEGKGECNGFINQT
jgi:hypothetical protein